jgi:hypothetical protein
VAAAGPGDPGCRERAPERRLPWCPEIEWGTASAQSCQISLDTNFNRDGTGRTTGTVCSHTIDVSF